MRERIQKYLPPWCVRVLRIILAWNRVWVARMYERITYTPTTHTEKVRVLFFHPGGLRYGGTEKALQIIARNLDRNKFTVSYLYAPQLGTDRMAYFSESDIALIPFSFTRSGGSIPHVLEHMTPRLQAVLEEQQVDVLITSGAGYPEHPIASLTKLPVVYYNMFGSINPQSNIKLHWCISQLITTRVQEALPHSAVRMLPIQSEGPDGDAPMRGQALRAQLGIPSDAIVFGRIGRPDDAIFDPIGIAAFARIATKYPNAHYILVAPPPVLRQWLLEHPVPRVHLLPPQTTEQLVWAFHAAIDVLAHFRYDGETMGLNIAESMLSGKAVITHRSKFWNAHLEFLDEQCACVAEVDDVTAYAAHMEQFAQSGGKERALRMGAHARVLAEPLFLIKKNISTIEQDLLGVVGR